VVSSNGEVLKESECVGVLNDYDVIAREAFIVEGCGRIFGRFVNCHVED
jgi:hypothetical protein